MIDLSYATFGMFLFAAASGGAAVGIVVAGLCNSCAVTKRPIDEDFQLFLIDRDLRSIGSYATEKLRQAYFAGAQR
jgi:hypothetical protein